MSASLDISEQSDERLYANAVATLSYFQKQSLLYHRQTEENKHHVHKRKERRHGILKLQEKPSQNAVALLSATKERARRLREAQINRMLVRRFVHLWSAQTRHILEEMRVNEKMALWATVIGELKGEHEKDITARLNALQITGECPEVLWNVNPNLRVTNLFKLISMCRINSDVSHADLFRARHISIVLRGEIALSIKATKHKKSSKEIKIFGRSSVLYNHALYDQTSGNIPDSSSSLPPHDLLIIKNKLCFDIKSQHGLQIVHLPIRALLMLMDKTQEQIHKLIIKRLRGYIKAYELTVRNQSTKRMGFVAPSRIKLRTRLKFAEPYKPTVQPYFCKMQSQEYEEQEPVAVIINPLSKHSTKTLPRVPTQISVRLPIY